MKTTRLASALALCLLAAAQAHAQASTALDTKSGLVSAQVLDTCKFTNSAPTINLVLGSLDPSSSNSKATTVVHGFSCTKDFSVQVGLQGQTVLLTSGPGLARQLTHKTDPTQFLAYTLTAALPNGNTGKGFSPGNELALHLTAGVLPADFVDARGGEYEDTLVVELRP